MPYQLPEVPAENAATYDQYETTRARLKDAQHDRAWVAVCHLLHNNVADARRAARLADLAFRRHGDWLERHEADLPRLLDEKYPIK